MASFLKRDEVDFMEVPLEGPPVGHIALVFSSGTDSPTG
jgi:hypothetical protein